MGGGVFKSPGAVVLCMSTHGVALVQSDCAVWTFFDDSDDRLVLKGGATPTDRGWKEVMTAQTDSRCSAVLLLLVWILETELWREMCRSLMTNCYSVVNDAPQWGTVWCVSTHTDTHAYSKTNLVFFSRDCSRVVITHFVVYMRSKRMNKVILLKCIRVTQKKPHGHDRIPQMNHFHVITSWPLMKVRFLALFSSRVKWFKTF